MATAVSPASKLQQSLALYQTTIGKKYVVAVSGAILFAFTIGHMLGNLQIYLPNAQQALKDYAALLHASDELLWAVRLVLLAALVAHFVTIFQLYMINKQARPQDYVKKTPTISTYASRTMYLSGPILLAFIVYHLSHLTMGTTHPNFVHMDPYNNLVYGFRQPVAAISYIIAMGMLGLHLVHGVWSMFQSVGFNHPRYRATIRAFATGAAAALAIGNISIPLAVITRLVGSELP
jgi:succinate dehydrogenase / fumarate reductase cytochrome b subunit